VKKKRTTRSVELTVERTEFFAPRGPRPPAVAWCAGCGRSATFASPGEAARSTGADLRAVFRRIEAAEIHFFETPDGRLLVCLDSLAPSG
jgi:hypothetical protein